MLPCVNMSMNIERNSNKWPQIDPFLVFSLLSTILPFVTSERGVIRAANFVSLSHIARPSRPLFAAVVVYISMSS